MKQKRILTLLSLSAVAICPLAPAATTALSLNFVGAAGASGTLAAGNTAGGPAVNSGTVGSLLPNWNNLTGGSSGTVGTLSAWNYRTSTVVATTSSVSWTSDLGGHQIPNTTSGINLAGGQNPVMMKGYLDVQNNASISLTGLNSVFEANVPYAVLVYFDGDNAAAWRVANFTINGVTRGGEDSENVNFNSGAGANSNGLFQLPIPSGTGNVAFGSLPLGAGNNNEGNYVLFPYLKGDSLTILAAGGANSGLARAPINGIQLIAIPEPGKAVLFILAMVPLSLRRRR